MMIDILRCQDFPHLRRANGRWRIGGSGPRSSLGPEFSLARLADYGELLRDYGVPDLQIVAMFLDLYWDAVLEASASEKAERAQGAGADCPESAVPTGAAAMLAALKAHSG